MTTVRDRRRVALLDGSLAGALGALGLVDALSEDMSVHGAGSPAAGAVGVVVSAALLSQRRLRPQLLPGVPLLWVGLGLITLGDLPSLFYGTFVPLLLTVYSAARHGSGHTAGLALVLSLGGLAWAHLSLPALGGWSGLAFNATATLTAFAVGHGLRRSEQRAVADALRAAEHEERARLATRTAVADERARITRDLHDLIGHSVSAMVVQAGVAEQAVGVDPDGVRDALREIRTTGTGALDEVRRIVALLRDPAEPVDLAPRAGVGT
jgi:signal transduction histidine kinase